MKRGVFVALALVAVVVTVALASTTVERASVQLRKGPGSFYPKTGELAKGDQVEILGEKGSWKKVRSGGLEGYLPGSALVAESRKGLGGLGQAIGTSEASVESETAGVKGFNEDVEKAHAEQRGMDWAAVNQLDKQSISSKQMLAFLEARGLTEGE